jgi:DNA-binding CsgD family transcriptional regulator
MLVKCDDKDFGILRGLLANKTYEEIAENQELALTTVKYGLSKIENHLKVTNRKELYACLAAYDLNI